MAIAAHWEDPNNSPGGRRSPRRKLLLEAQGALASGGETRVLVHNVSATGLLIESDSLLAAGESIEIGLPLVGPTRARVMWSSGSLYGCQFDKPVSDAALSAAQLQGAAAHQELEIHPRLENMHDETFGARLQRLRSERGLTQTHIAEQLGVSKPTVWAWEQDRARPVESRMNALSQVLGVSIHELVAGSGNVTLQAMLAGARERIAAVVGTDASKIKIFIEL